MGPIFNGHSWSVNEQRGGMPSFIGVEWVWAESQINHENNKFACAL